MRSLTILEPDPAPSAHRAPESFSVGSYASIADGAIGALGIEMLGDHDFRAAHVALEQIPRGAPARLAAHIGFARDRLSAPARP